MSDKDPVWAKAQLDLTIQNLQDLADHLRDGTVTTDDVVMAQALVTQLHAIRANL